ncbi:MAG: hypothetical protein KBG11_09510 [Bacteroidia bacterium]|nr:hypothetical protein [Bacteroidia bacterium]
MINIKGARLVFTYVLLFCFFGFEANAQNHFYFSPVCIEAQNHIATLRLKKAEQLLAAEKKLHPTNVAIDFLENYIDYYRLVIGQDYSNFKAIEAQMDARLKLVKKLPASTPYLLYTQSEINLQLGFVKSFNSEYVGAMLAFRSAYQLAKSNVEKFPDFKPSQKTVGMFKTLLGTIPSNYKWMLSVAGLSGDFDGGMAQIHQYFKTDNYPAFVLDKQNTEFYYTLFMLNFDDKQKAWDFCNQHTKDYQTNLLSCYLRAFTASKSAQNDEAILVLQNRPKTADYEPFYGLDYLHGQFKLNRLDDDAEHSLKRFVSFNKGKLYMKDAYRRISWSYLIKNDIEKFKVYRELSKRYGSANSEEDQNIERELAMGSQQDVVILKARLLFDGGYYQRAEDMIKQREPEQLKSDYHKLEYYYRYARILQEQKKYNKAVEYYDYVIKNSPTNTPYYFAPNACLQLGYIYQNLGFKQLAKSNFNKVSIYTKAEFIEGIKVKSAKELATLK